MPVTRNDEITNSSALKQEQVQYLVNNPEQFIALAKSHPAIILALLKNDFHNTECLDLLANAQKKSLMLLQRLTEIAKCENTCAELHILNNFIIKIIPQGKHLLDKELPDFSNKAESSLPFIATFRAFSGINNFIYLMAEKGFKNLGMMLCQLSPRVASDALIAKISNEPLSNAIGVMKKSWSDENIAKALLPFFQILNSLELSLTEGFLPHFIKETGNVILKMPFDNETQRDLLIEFYGLSPANMRNWFRNDVTELEKSFNDEENTHMQHKAAQERLRAIFRNSVEKNLYNEDALPYVLEHPQHVFALLKKPESAVLFDKYIEELSRKELSDTNASDSAIPSNALSSFMAKAYQQNIQPLTAYVSQINTTQETNNTFKSLLLRAPVEQVKIEMGKPNAESNLIKVIFENGKLDLLKEFGSFLSSINIEKSFLSHFSSAALNRLVIENKREIMGMVIGYMQAAVTKSEFEEYMLDMPTENHFLMSMLTEKWFEVLENIVCISPAFFFSHERYDDLCEGIVTSPFRNESNKNATDFSQEKQVLLNCILNYLLKHQKVYIGLFKSDFILAESYFKKFKENQLKILAADKEIQGEKKPGSGFLNSLLSILMTNSPINIEINIDLPRPAKIETSRDAETHMNALNVFFEQGPENTKNLVIMKYKKADGTDRAILEIAKRDDVDFADIKKPFDSDAMFVGSYYFFSEETKEELQTQYYNHLCQIYFSEHLQNILITLLETRKNNQLERFLYVPEVCEKILRMKLFKLWAAMQYEEAWILQGIARAMKYNGSLTRFEYFAQTLPKSREVLDRVIARISSLEQDERCRIIATLFLNPRKTMDILIAQEPQIAQFLFSHFNEGTLTQLSAKQLADIQKISLVTVSVELPCTPSAPPMPPPFNLVPDESTGNVAYPVLPELAKPGSLEEEPNILQQQNHQIEELKQAFKMLKEQTDMLKKENEEMKLRMNTMESKASIPKSALLSESSSEMEILKTHLVAYQKQVKALTVVNDKQAETIRDLKMLLIPTATATSTPPLSPLWRLVQSRPGQEAEHQKTASRKCKEKQD